MNERAEKHPRFRFRISYSLAGLFVVVAVLATGLAFWRPLQIIHQRQATRAWIERHRGEMFLVGGARDRWGSRGRVEPALGGQAVSPLRKLMGDQAVVMIAIPDGVYTEGEVSRIKADFPEADIWFDE